MKWVSAEEVVRTLPFPRLVDCLEVGFRQGCELPQRHQHTVSRDPEADGFLLLMPAWNDRFLGTKISTVFPDNSMVGLGAVQGSYVLCEGATGLPLLCLDGLALTLRRTAAASALAARFLARPQSRRLLVLGTGNLAPHLAQAHASVFRLDEIEFWGRDVRKAKEAAKTCEGLAETVKATSDLEVSARAADIITCATMSTSPLVRGAWLAEGAHLDLVGGFTYEMRESDSQAVERSRVYVDTREGALSEAGDLLQPIDEGVFTPADIRGDLFELTRGQVEGRQSELERTLFKSGGCALEDLAATALVAETLGI